MGARHRIVVVNVIEAVCGRCVTAADLRHELQTADSPELRRRRNIIRLSLLGMASMAAVTLLQTGIVKHLPDPPSPGFDSDRVNSSDTAYGLGAPDGTLSLAGLALNVPLAAWGGGSRYEKQPWIPLTAALKAGIEAVAAGWYFYQMPAKEKKWCAYCIAGAAVNLAVLALTIPEAIQAWDALRSKRG